jgi:hypothetical protein
MQCPLVQSTPMSCHVVSVSCVSHLLSVCRVISSDTCMCLSRTAQSRLQGHCRNIGKLGVQEHQENGKGESGQ